MSARKPRSSKEPTAKKPSKPQLKANAELAAEKALEATHVEPMPDVTPLELAHLVAAMGLGDQDDGPAKALSLVSRSAAYITGMKAQFKCLDRGIAEDRANMAKIMAVLGLSEEVPDRTFSVAEVIAKMHTEPLKVAGKMLRGKDLWDEFRRQIDPQTERPGRTAEADQHAPEVYSLADLIRVYQQFTEWRDVIATGNVAKGSKNLAKANRERAKKTLVDGAEAVDAVPLPRMRQ